MDSMYSKDEMIEAISQYLQKAGYQVLKYDQDLEPARVPLFGKIHDKKGEITKEIFVDIITERHIKADSYFSDRRFSSIKERGLQIINAGSANFFRHYFPNALIYWAIPDYVDKNGPAFEEFETLCSKYNIGLLEVSKNNGDFQVNPLREKPVSIIAQRTEELKNTIELIVGRSLSQKEMGDLSEKVGDYSQEDLSYLVFYPAPIYKARDIASREPEQNISKELINRMEDIKNISYRDILVEFAEGYHKETRNDYDVALEYCKKIWGKYNLPFPTFHKDFENILKLDPNYRDHFIHAFQVFLFGAYVIDKFYGELKMKVAYYKKKDGGRVEDAWAMASIYHDYAYMIQKFDEWTVKIFQKALQYDKDFPAKLALEESYIKEGFMFKTKEILDYMKIKTDEVCLNFFYDRILKKRNHGLLASLSLLKYFDKNEDCNLTSTVKLSSAKAIALHDRGVWEFLSGLADDSSMKDDTYGKEYTKVKPIEKICFLDDPITFLLNLSDCVQEEGRPGVEHKGWKAQLENVDFKNNKIFVEISFMNRNADDAYEEKRKEIQKVKRFLSGGNRFFVGIKNINNGESSGFEI